MRNFTMQWKNGNVDDLQEALELKTNKKKKDWQSFVYFLEVLNNTPDEDFETAIQQVFNVPLFLRAIAVDVLVNNWDSYAMCGRNYYLYQDPSSCQFQWIPWDYNLAFDGELTNPAPAVSAILPVVCLPVLMWRLLLNQACFNWSICLL